MVKFLKLLVFILLASGIAGLQNSAHAASRESLIRKGNAFFSAGNYDAAISAYDEAAVSDPESPYLYFNKGAALYKKEEYAAAREAFQQAAIKSMDISIEAKSKYNLGLCFFKEAERQKDSDLKKSLESYGSSVRSFQEALALDPDFLEAAENIEMVRLIMKSVLDEIKKQEEAARQQQEQTRAAAEKIRELIEKQETLLNENRSLKNNAQPESSGDDALDQKIEKIETAQDRLKQETRELAKQLENQQVSAAGASGSKADQRHHPAKENLDTSADEQENAVKRFSENDTRTAEDHQQKSLDALNKSLESLTQPQNKKGEEQQQENQQQSPEVRQQQQTLQEQSQESSSAEDKKQQPEANQEEQPSAAMLSDDADSILDEEKENKNHRIPYSPGGFKEVDKDW